MSNVRRYLPRTRRQPSREPNLAMSPLERIPWRLLERSARIQRLSPEMLNHPQPLILTRSAYAAIEATVGARPAESGGILGGVRGSGVVEHFRFDAAADTTGATYYPDVDTINRLLREEWNPEGVNLLGFVHSHPRGVVRPSYVDAEYASRILAGIPELDRLLVPIAQSEADTDRFTLRGYALGRHGGSPRIDKVPVLVADSVPPVDPGDFPEFARVRDAYDLPALAASRVVAVGCGGSATFLEDMARAGVGEFVLIDPDHVDAPNIATQQAYRHDLGVDKVSAIARRLTDISPHARVWTIPALLDDLTDDAMRQLCLAPLSLERPQIPASTLLCAFTDNFWAQARVSRIALNLGAPLLSATVYAEGRGIEVAFSAPGITAACVRCVTSSRYRAYLERGFRNDVGSAGSPIYATSRLNALKEPIALTLLQATSRVRQHDHPSAGRTDALLAAMRDRNLVVNSLDPDIVRVLGLRMFDRIEGAAVDGLQLSDATLWLEQRPDGPETGYPSCPECGGSGDLTDSIGRFVDTRRTPRELGQHSRDGVAARGGR